MFRLVHIARVMTTAGPVLECSLEGYKRGFCVPRQQAIIGTLSSAIVQIVDWVTAPVVIVRV
jgi:hypothetical protein